MTIGIYTITHRATDKRYIGKSIDVERRLRDHRRALSRPVRAPSTNRLLYAAVQEFGWSAFDTELLEIFGRVDEVHIAERELFWMDHFNSCARNYGFNLRRDSSTQMEVHADTRALMSNRVSGFNNPNFANYWSPERKSAMSEDAKRRHSEGRYGEEWRRKQSASSRRTWSDPAKRRAMGEKVGRAMQRYDYLQYDRDGNLIRRWSSIREIVGENPSFKWQNIYSVCHGHKPTYRGFVWRQDRRA